jgi:hypothetical protein
MHTRRHIVFFFLNLIKKSSANKKKLKMGYSPARNHEDTIGTRCN